MSTVRHVATAMLAAGVIAGLESWMDEHRSERRSSMSFHDTAAISNGGAGELPDRWHGGSRPDLYGNHIEEAVGDYRVDPRGGIFERHSPVTEVARLPEPST